ncbi:MAG: YiiX/YebB-like N1pC/P60 family cysteine hydrolase [Thermotogota bacterium]
MKKYFFIFNALIMHVICIIINKFGLFGEDSYEISTFFLFSGWGVFIIKSIYFSMVKLSKNFKVYNNFKFYIFSLTKTFLLSLLTFGSDIFGNYSFILNIALFISFNLLLILLIVKIFMLFAIKLSFLKNIVSIFLVISISLMSFSYDFNSNLNTSYNPVFDYYDNYSKISRNSFDFIIEYLAKAITGRELTNRKNKFIKNSQQNDIQKRLEPGDILLRRMNWQLTNIGVGGFWTHSGMYLGNLDELDRYFKGTKQLGDLNYSEWLKKEYSLIYDLMIKNPDFVLYESNYKGVVLNEFDSMGRSDFFSALRPNLTKEEKFEAINNSFKYFGKNYDYKFNFHDDQELVCSELLYVAYKKTNLINFKPYYSTGKYFMRPDDFVKFYLENPNELDFVVFYDSSEKKKIAFEASEDSFKKSINRTPLDIMMR